MEQSQTQGGFTQGEHEGFTDVGAITNHEGFTRVELITNPGGLTQAETFVSRCRTH